VLAVLALVPAREASRVGRHEQVLLEVEVEFGPGRERLLQRQERVERDPPHRLVDPDLVVDAGEHLRRDRCELPGACAWLHTDEHAPSSQVVRREGCEHLPEQLGPAHRRDGDAAAVLHAAILGVSEGALQARRA